MSIESLEADLKSFVASKTKVVAFSDIDRETKLFSSGLLDSIVFIELLLFIEARYKVRLTATTGADMKTLDSIRQIIEIIERFKA